MSQPVETVEVEKSTGSTKSTDKSWRVLMIKHLPTGSIYAAGFKLGQ